MAYVNGAKPGNMKQYTGRVSRRPSKPAELSYKLLGGPWDGHTVALATPPTYQMTVQGSGAPLKGRYVSAGGNSRILKWQAAI